MISRIRLFHQCEFLYVFTDFSYHFEKKVLTHWPHPYGFSSVCVMMCFMRLLFPVKGLITMVAFTWLITRYISYKKMVNLFYLAYVE